MSYFGSCVFSMALLALLAGQCASQIQGTSSSQAGDLSIDCVQCNMRQYGILNTCESPAQRHNCTGCMKTLTKIKIKESGTLTGRYRVSEVVSRYCMVPGSSRRKEEGCYKHANNGGYTEQCFCYTHNCNSRATKLTLGVPAGIALFSYVLTSMGILQLF